MAAVRTTVQLLLIGFVLRWLFEPGQAWYFVLAMMSAMTFIAGISAVQRTDRRYAGIWLDSVISMWATSWLMTAIALFGVVQVKGQGRVVVHAAIRDPASGDDPRRQHLERGGLSLDRVAHELVSRR